MAKSGAWQGWPYAAKAMDGQERRLARDVLSLEIAPAFPALPPSMVVVPRRP